MSLHALLLPVLAAVVLASSSPSSSAPLASSSSSSSPSSVAGKHAFGEACSSDGDCASNACSHGKNRSYCSVKCSADAQCPTPPTAGSCNERGYCRAPKK